MVRLAITGSRAPEQSCGQDRSGSSRVRTGRVRRFSWNSADERRWTNVTARTLCRSAPPAVRDVRAARSRHRGYRLGVRDLWFIAIVCQSRASWRLFARLAREQLVVEAHYCELPACQPDPRRS